MSEQGDNTLTPLEEFIAEKIFAMLGHKFSFILETKNYNAIVKPTADKRWCIKFVRKNEKTKAYVMWRCFGVMAIILPVIYKDGMFEVKGDYPDRDKFALDKGLIDLVAAYDNDI